MPGPDTSAWGRSEPGTGPIPVYDERKDLAIETRSRIDTPPIVEFPNETLEEIYAKQWDGVEER
jgi:hypothetical protein